MSCLIAIIPKESIMEPHKPEERPYQKQIFKALTLSGDESKYITVEKDLVYLVLPIEAEFRVSIGNTLISFDYPDSKRVVSMEAEDMFADIDDLLTKELHKGGFELNCKISCNKDSHYVFTGEAEYYKEISSDEDAKEAANNK